MMSTDIEKAVLAAAVEDYTGLWELVWELNVSSPDSTESERRALAASAVRRLLSDGDIGLYERSDSDGPVEEIPATQWENVLSASVNWREPTVASIQFIIGATEKGERRYENELD